MCFDADSLPPITPIAGAAVSHEDLVLEAPDGNRFAAFDAVPEDHIGTGVIVLPDVRGLSRFYEELALRFAERGVRAVAIDYFGRTAGVEKRPDDWDYAPHVAQTRYKTLQADIGAAAHRLRTPEGGDCRAVFAVGFCFGGSNSWLAATGGHGLSGAVGFYGRPGPRNDEPGPLDRAADMHGTPILGLMGGADPSIPAADVAGFEAALADADVENEFVIYEGAPHSFFDRKYEEFQEASEDAWLRTLGFIAHHGGQDPR
jgi:carboxymethylenebutenolidase